jgi:hypothetical protein
LVGTFSHAPLVALATLDGKLYGEWRQVNGE